MKMSKQSLLGRCVSAFKAAAFGASALALTAFAAPTDQAEAHVMGPVAAPAAASSMLDFGRSTLVDTFANMHRVERLRAFENLEQRALSVYATHADKVAYQAFIFPTEAKEQDGHIGRKTRARAAEVRAELNTPIRSNPFGAPDLSMRQDVADEPTCATDTAPLAGALCVEGGRYSSRVGFRWDPLNPHAHGGSRWLQMHQGVDYAAPIGTPVETESEAVLIKKGWNRDFGNFAVLAYPSGALVFTAHHAQITAEVGDVLEAGQSYATIGSTGRRSTGPHLHATTVAFDTRSGQWKMVSAEYLADKGGINASHDDLQAAIQVMRRHTRGDTAPEYLNFLMQGETGDAVAQQVAQATARPEAGTLAALETSMPSASANPVSIQAIAASLSTQDVNCTANGAPLRNSVLERMYAPKPAGFRFFG